MNRPGVGVGTFVIFGNKILLAKRKNAHGAGGWNLPGGHVEFGEDPKDTAVREVLEETGLIVENPQFVSFTNDIFEKEQKHYITLFYKVYTNSSDAKIMEPDKCEKWEWFAPDNLPTPLFLPLQNLLKQASLSSFSIL